MTFSRLATGAVIACLSFAGNAVAGECEGRSGALGTSRIIAASPSEYRRLGLIQYRETLPLQDREVVLTFDDGPLPPYTPKVLDALAAECVKATFFAVGQMAEAFPALIQREHREGHTVGTHSQHHPFLNRLPIEQATKEIEDGIASVNRALGASAAPFFRFPYFDPTPATEARALNLGLIIWSADLHARDWDRITPNEVASIAIERLERKRKGILLLHDIHERTALALPLLLSEMKKRGFRIVHVVPADSTHHQAKAEQNQWKAMVP